MNKLLGLILLVGFLSSCDKDSGKEIGSCDMDDVYEKNEEKAVDTRGVWGTVSSMEGDCMPFIGADFPSCSHCPAKRKVRVYEYTLKSEAVPAGNSTVLYESFNTALVAETEADAEGFYQLSLQPGHYTLVVVEDGKLYAAGLDGQGGLSPVIIADDPLHINLVMTYKAVF